MSLSPAVPLSLFLALLAQASRPTNAILAGRTSADMRIGERTVGQLNDLQCVVERYQGDWAWVRDAVGQAGWVRRTEVVPMSEAVEYFTDKIRREPAEAEWYNRRAAARQFSGELDAALADAAEAIRLDTRSATYYNTRGNIYAAKSDYDRALSDYNVALGLDANLAAAWSNAGDARYRQGNYQKALENYGQAIRLEPNDALLESRRAWIWATAADGRIRDGKRAIASARRACELAHWQQWADIDTLAAAYAEAGDFANALKYAGQALDLAPSDDPQREQVAAHLKLFEDQKPVRE